MQPQKAPDIERRLALLSAYEAVSKAIGASLDLGEICRRALEAAVRVLDATSGGLYAVDWQARRLVAIAHIGVTDEFRREFANLPLDESSLSGKAALYGESQAAAAGTLPPVSRKIAGTLGGRSFAVVPISSRGKVLGTLSVMLDPERGLSAEEVEMLSNITAPIGIAMDNAQLHAQATELNARLIIAGFRLRSLLDAAEDISSKLDVEAVMRRIVEQAARITNASEGLVALAEGERVVTYQWWDGKSWRPFEFSWEKGQGGPGWVLLTGQPYLTNDARTDPHTVPEMVAMMKLRNFIIAPMLSPKGEVLGAFEVDNKAEGKPFTDDDLQLVLAFSRLATVALSNARLFRDVDSTKNLLQTMIDNAVGYINYLDANLTIRRASRKSAAFFGMEIEDLLGKNVMDVFPWLREHEAAETLFQAMSTGQRQERKEVRISLAEQGDTYWDLVYVPTVDVSGGVEGVLSYAVDVTEKVKARKAAEERAHREQVIGEIGLAVSSEASLQDVLRTAVVKMAEVMGTGGGALFLLDRTRHRLRGAVATPRFGLAVESMEFGLSEAMMARRSFRRRRPIHFGRGDLRPVSQHFLEEIGVLSVLAVPLFAAGRPIGLVYLTYESLRPQPSGEELDFATSLANQCAIAIDKARLLDEARTQRERLASVIEQMPEGVLIVAAPEGRVVLLNRRARQIAGKGLKVGMPISAISEQVGLYHPDGRPFQTEELALYRAMDRGEAIRPEVQIIRRPGRKQVTVITRAVPLLDERGQVREVVLVFQDITALKEAQRQAEEAASSAEQQRKELDAIVETLAEGVLITDASGSVVRANQAAARILGFKSYKETLPRVEDYGFLDLRDSQGRPLSMEEWPITRAMRGGSFMEQEVMATGADGRQRHLLVGGSYVRGSQGEVALAIVVFRDITAIRDFERQREEFISVIAHDLRTSLTVLRAYVQLLLTPSLQKSMPEEAQKPLEAINTSTRRLERMISDLLDVSRIEARRLKLEMRRVDLAALVRNVVERMEELTRGHQVQVKIEEPMPEIRADPDRIEQILSNLLSNAGKYSYPETPITVEVEMRVKEIMVSVTNLGPGIKPEDTPRLFARFHRTEAARREKVPGLGLGLYIAKGLVEAHGGRMWVESEPEKHATFRFVLPLEKPLRRRSRRRTPASRRGSGSGRDESRGRAGLQDDIHVQGEQSPV